MYRSDAHLPQQTPFQSQVHPGTADGMQRQARAWHAAHGKSTTGTAAQEGPEPAQDQLALNAQLGEHQARALIVLAPIAEHGNPGFDHQTASGAPGEEPANRSARAGAGEVVG